MNILVLGGSGFIGSHIVDSLLADGHFVRVFSRHEFDQLPAGCECVIGSFLDVAKLSEAMTGIDVVIHAISSTVPATSAVNPVFDIQTNLIGTVELLRLMQSAGINRLIYLSSGGTVYGNPRISPVTEDMPLNPISSYGAVKVSIENFIHVFSQNTDLSPIILRPSNPFGERQGHKGVQGLISTVLNNMLSNKETVIYGNGETVRDYIYVKDFASLVCNAVRSDKTGIYNVGSGQGLSVLQVLSAIESVTGSSIRRQYKQKRAFDVNEIVLDITKATSDFNWRPSISLEEGIRRQYEWLRRAYGCTN